MNMRLCVLVAVIATVTGHVSAQEGVSRGAKQRTAQQKPGLPPPYYYYPNGKAISSSMRGGWNTRPEWVNPIVLSFLSE